MASLRMRRLLVDGALLGLLPLVAAQGAWVRRTTPLLADAAPPCRGLCRGGGAAIHLLVVGESTVAGVGVRDHADGLTGQLAVHLATHLNRTVTWEAVGLSGATAAQLRRDLLPQLTSQSVDLAVVVLGVNDTIQLTGPARWQHELAAIVATLRATLGAPPVLLAGVPPLARFPALPVPLRSIMGWRARLLDAASAALAASSSGLWHCATPRPEPNQFARDSFHPGPAGYAAWGRVLADFVAEKNLIRDAKSPSASAPDIA